MDSIPTHPTPVALPLFLGVGGSCVLKSLCLFAEPNGVEETAHRIVRILTWCQEAGVSYLTLGVLSSQPRLTFTFGHKASLLQRTTKPYTDLNHKWKD